MRDDVIRNGIRHAAGLATAAILAVFCALPAMAQTGGTPEIGTRISVGLDDLPPPHDTPAVAAPAEVEPRPEGLLPSVPAGFEANIFAEGFAYPRWMEVAPNGDVLLALPREGRIVLLRDADGDGRAEQMSTLLSGLTQPHGMMIRDGWLYVAEPRTVKRARYTPGDTEIADGARRAAVKDLLGDGRGHWTRNFAQHPDGRRVYVAIGSRSNVEPEPEPRASIQEFEFDEKGLIRGTRTFAAGLRNPVGIAFYPGTDDLYTVVNERDGLGEELVPDYLTRVTEGAFYGWPWAYLSPAHPQPELGDEAPEKVAATVTPDFLFRSHSAPIGLAFYDAAQFPHEFRGDAFVALRGSWNAAQPRGYYVARVPFENGRPAGWYEPFMTGFRLDRGETPARVWGRPAGLAIAADGSLLVADDTSGTIWRVSYTGAE